MSCVALPLPYAALTSCHVLPYPCPMLPLHHVMCYLILVLCCPYIMSCLTLPLPHAALTSCHVLPYPCPMLPLHHVVLPYPCPMLPLHCSQPDLTMFPAGNLDSPPVCRVQLVGKFASTSVLSFVVCCCVITSLWCGVTSLSLANSRFV